MCKSCVTNLRTYWRISFTWRRNIPQSTQQGRYFNFFLRGPKFLLFFNATELLKNWKKQHFICRNLTLFIVPFFFSFFSFLSLFSLFSCFFSFFFFLRGATAPSPPQMTPLLPSDITSNFGPALDLKNGPPIPHFTIYDLKMGPFLPPPQLRVIHI